MSKRIHLNIGGMTCINCQHKIEKSLNKKDGVIHASVSFSKGTADIEYDENMVSVKSIIKTIEDLDYEVFASDRKSAFDVADAVSISVLIVALYVILQSLGILNYLAPVSLAETGMGYGMLFVIGLITSVHCIAMCGGIGLSQSLPQKAQGKVMMPSLAYNMGRVCSYTVIGAALGFIGMIIGGGSDIAVSSVLQGILKILAGLIMVVMGINMLGIFPWLRRFTIHMPKAIVRSVGEKRRDASGPFAIGLLNGLMPCGPLQAMWIVALAAGSPARGALSMLLFSLGTVPLMLGLGSVVSALGKRFTDQVMKVGAVFVVVLGLSMLSQGGALSGWLPSDLLLYLIIAFFIAGVLLSMPNRSRQLRYIAYAASIAVIIGAYALWNVREVPAGNIKSTENTAQASDGVQIVNSTLSYGRYPDITVQAGIPVRWIIDVPDGVLNGCNSRMLIQDYGIEHTFSSGENVIEFVPDKAGTVRYSCWMGMIYGSILVTDGQAAGSQATGSQITGGQITGGQPVPVITDGTSSCCDATAVYTDDSSCCGEQTDYTDEYYATINYYEDTGMSCCE